MKLWLLDADVLIDFLELGIFDKLVSRHEVYIAETVLDEVKYFPSPTGGRTKVDLRTQYLDQGLIIVLDATPAEVNAILSDLPLNRKYAIDPGEIESMAILKSHEELTFCCCDAAGIRTLPFIDCDDRGISAEELLMNSGLSTKGIKTRHTKEYFENNLSQGRTEKIYNL